VSSLVSILGTLAWGGVVAADTAAWVQLLVSQPLVAGFVTGCLWGRPEVGLELGAILQLFACGTLPIGGRTPEDFATGSVVGVAAACLLERAQPIASAQGGPLMFGVLAAFAVALVGKSWIAWQRRHNEGLARWCEQRLALGDLTALGRAQWAGVATAFSIGVLWTAVAFALVQSAGDRLMDRQGVAFGQAWQVGAPVLWGFGAGAVARNFVQGRKPGLFFWIALVAFLLVRLVTA
jgi:mannose/fructose/N-acetylgalactosamine-specific phosphotransferase system component IIC